uniref:zinc finger BED domain-containing protein RICESLEEPER 2-like n=1 Tax=Erigeron canadensis TaxID=72917 RepID=UPI001CB977D3|nr:zinc finger BED domain-containing protein RICESLEEPER 2-like [Erigeron canadensis]
MIRCCAHILNLVVKDGLSEIASVIGEVREVVKYINHSEARRQSFSKVADKQNVKDRRLLIDCPTRWNSTYEMLSLALKFKDVIPEYALDETHFKHVPSYQDWENVEKVCKILKVFKMCTNIISGSHYPTANLYLIEVYKVKETLDEASESEDDFIRKMVKKMKEKFDKYWGECHLLMAIASVLDPKFKKWLIGQAYPILYTPVEAANNIKSVEDALDRMYKEYLEAHDALVREAATRGSEFSGGGTTTKSNENTSHGSGWDAYMQFVKNVDMEKPRESELKMYYDEGIYKVQGGMETFSALDWWNVHKFKYPVLSKMATDVLAVPVSTVASEAIFSAGGRVIDPYRSNLAPETVEMLICGGDWIRQHYGLKSKTKVCFENLKNL